MLSSDTLLELTRLKAGDHIGFLYTSVEEHLAILGSFVRLGLERGERVMVHTGGATAADLGAALQAAGLDVEVYLDGEQLVFVPLPEEGALGDSLEPDELLGRLQEAVEQALRDGCTALRIVEETPPSQTEPPYATRLVEYEACLNEFLPGRPCLVLSAYDLARSSPTLLLEVLHTHPTVIVDTQVYDNADLYYIPKTELLGPDRPAAELRSRLDSLAAHHRIEKARSESEEKYRKLFEEALDGIALADIESGIILDCNQALLDLVGRSREEVVGQHQRILHPPEDTPGGFSSSFDQHRTEGLDQVLESRIITKAGEIKIVEIKANLIELGGRLCLRGVFHNVTRRKRVEQDLQVRDWAIATAINAIAFADLSGNLTYVNRAFLELWGYEEHQVLGRPTVSFWRDADQADQVVQSLRGQGHWIGELEAVRADGTLFSVQLAASLVTDRTGQPICLMGSFVDVTQRKQAEAALDWASAVNAALAELSQALLTRSSLQKIAGLVLEQGKRLTGSAFGFVGHIDAQDLVLSSTTPGIWESCEVANRQAVFHNMAGLWGWVLQNRQPLLTNTPRSDARSTGVPPGHLPMERFLAAPAMAGETLVGIVALANPGRDYTGRDLELVERLAQLYALAIQRQRAEDTLRERTAELQARNEDLDAFAHTVAHDLKSPLTSVLGFAEILENYPALPEEQRAEYLQAIARHSRTMDNIVQELLLLASVRKENVQRSPLDMARIMSEVQHRTADMVEQSGGEVVGPAEWPEAVGYGPWIAEVWINYISNALKYGGDPPRVELGAAVQPDGLVRFWVRDNGAGLTAEERDTLFKPFTRLDQVRARGHGLGLSIVRRIVEKLGGQVGVECPAGGGCSFWFTLPAHPSYGPSTPGY
jgi:PAS domain S-box-containing protein